MRLVHVAIVALVFATPSAAFAQALTADIQRTADEADATALRAQVTRADAELVSCLGASARGRSETVLWLSVAPSGAVTVSLALHRGPTEGVGPCIVEHMRGWRLAAGARRRIEMVLRSGAPSPSPPPTPSARPPTPSPTPSARPPTPSPAPALPPTAPAPASPPSGELPDVTLSYGPPSVSGTYSRGDVQRVALMRRARMRRCYAEAVAAEPTLAGEVVLAFRISPAGRVESARRDESTVARPQLENCFVRAVRTWRFGERADATAPTSVRLRLHLSPTASP